MHTCDKDLRVQTLEGILTSDIVTRYAADDRSMLMPDTYQALSQATADANTSIAAIAAIIEGDPALSMRILQLVNLAFFGIAQRTTSIPIAVSMLSTDLLKSLVISAQLCRAMELAPLPSFSLSLYHSYSTRVGRLARCFAGNDELAEDAFTAGLMLSVGQLVLALQAPELFEQALQRVTGRGEPLQVAEMEILGTTHAEVGALLLSTWGLPFPIVECVALHLRPRRVGPGDCKLLAFAHAAEALTGIASCKEPEAQLDVEFLQRAGYAGEVPRWRQLAEAP